MDDQPQQATHNPDSDANLSESASTPDVNQLKTLQRELERQKGLYSGSQRSLTMTQQALNEAKSRVEALEAQLASIAAEKEVAVSELSKALSELQQKAETLAEENNRLTKQREVRRKIATDFPELSLFYDQDNLMIGIENLQGDALDEYLKRFSSALSTFKERATVQLLEGASPPAPTVQKPATVSSDELLERVMNARPGSEEYRKLMEAYLKSISGK